MSAYTSQGWSANGSTVYPGDPRGSHEVERRDFRPEGGDFGIRQNFHGRDSPPTNSDSSSYNRSHGEEFDRHYPSPPPERGQFYPPSEPVRRAKYHYNGHPQQRSSLLPLQRPRHRHSHNNAGHAMRPWGPQNRERRSPYVYDERNRGPILRPEYHHGYNGHYPIPQQNLALPSEFHSFRDPRMIRTNFADGSSMMFKSQYIDHIAQLAAQITREHSYCGKASSTGDRDRDSMEYEPSLPRTLLSVVSKKISKNVSEPSPPRQVATPKPVGVQPSPPSQVATPKPVRVQPSPVATVEVQPSPPRQVATPKPVIVAASQVTTPKPVRVQPPVKISHWPVVSNHSVENFTMDLGEDIDSGVDSATDEERKEKPVVTTEGIVRGVVRKPFLGFHSKDVSSSSWRLSPVLNKIPENPQEDVQSQEKPIVDQQVTEVQRMRRGNLNKGQQSEVKKKCKRRVKRRFTKIDKKKKNQKSDGVPAEIKLLLSGDFTPEILTSRSRAESFALARREVMEKEIEVHERERIQTARKGTDTEDSVVANGVLNLSCLTDTSSEYSAGMTTSSSLTMSQDQGSSSHDRDSGLQDLDSSVQDTISVLSSDSLLDDFPPELVARCKRIAHDKSSGDTALHKVCRNGKMDMVRCLLFYMKTDPNVADNAGWTPLHEACSNHRLVIANFLLKSGADANASARDGTRPIHDAIDIGALDIVQSLVQHGADPTAELGDKTPLYLAKTNKRPEIYDYLLPIVNDYQARRKAQMASSVAPSTKSTKRVIKHSVEAQYDDDLLTLPINGYDKNSPSFGKELDFPLVYICPILELSDTPMLTVYNFEIVVGCSNPRRHNFYLLPDLLEALGMSESQLRQHCSEISALEMTAGEFSAHVKKSVYVNTPASIMAMPQSTKIKLLPVCSHLRELLDIQTINLDD